MKLNTHTHSHTHTHTHTHSHTLTHTHTHTHTHLYILQTKVVYSLVCLQTKVVYSLVCEPLGWFLKKKPRGAGRGAPTNHARLPQTIGKTLWFVKFQSGQSSIQWFVQTTPRKKVPTKNTQTGNKPLWFFFTVSLSHTNMHKSMSCQNVVPAKSVHVVLGPLRLL